MGGFKGGGLKGRRRMKGGMDERKVGVRRGRADCNGDCVTKLHYTTVSSNSLPFTSTFSSLRRNLLPLLPSP